MACGFVNLSVGSCVRRLFRRIHVSSLATRGVEDRMIFCDSELQTTISFTLYMKIAPLFHFPLKLRRHAVMSLRQSSMVELELHMNNTNPGVQFITIDAEQDGQHR